MSIAHEDIPDTSSHEPKNISTASAGQAYIADGDGSGDWTEVMEGLNNFVTVNAQSDFPDPDSSGYIDLEEDTIYCVSGEVS